MGGGKKDRTGKRRQKDKGRKMSRYEEKSTVSCQSKRTATQCLIHALSELCGRCREPTWVKAFKDVLNLPDTPIKKGFIVLWGTRPALYTPHSYSCRSLQNTFVSISIHCSFNFQWDMGGGGWANGVKARRGCLKNVLLFDCICGPLKNMECLHWQWEKREAISREALDLKIQTLTCKPFITQTLRKKMELWWTMHVTEWLCS